jgi:hypothetical protein
MTYGPEHKLSNEISDQCQALFVKYQAKIVKESPYPQPFGNAWVVVRVRDIMLRFMCDRGAPIVEIKSVKGLGEWQWLDSAIGGMAPSNWADWCDLFIANYARLEKLFG